MTIFRSSAPVQPPTLTVEQTATVLGVARSTAYELVRSGDIDSIRIRRRIVVPVAHLAERLGVTARDIWTVVQTRPPSDPYQPAPQTASAEHAAGPEDPSLF